MGDQVLWNKAMEKLKVDKSKFDSDDIFNIAGLVNDYDYIIREGVIVQIKRDMGIYKKYDAIAMWVGDGGLIEHEPKFITELVKMFGIKE